MSFEFTGAYSLPGIAAALETVERQFWWGRWENQIWFPGVIAGASRDVGNVYPDVLRPGLLLGRIAATGRLTPWNPTAVDGSDMLIGVLGYAQKMQRLGADQDRWIGWVMVGGCLKADSLLIPGASDYGIVGHANEFLVRSQAYGRFMFDDMVFGSPFGSWQRVVTKTANYTVQESDNNTLFTTRGATAAVEFTLPVTSRRGLRFGFYNAADQNMKVTAGTPDTLVVFNDIAADSISYETANARIGGFLEVIGDGTGWLVINHSGQVAGAGSQIVTIAT